MIFKHFLKKYLFQEGKLFYKILKEVRLKNDAHKLKKYGHHLLRALFDAALENNIPVWLEFGTLLGAYREKSFIKHDFDIDCGMYANDYSLAFEDNLLSKGFIKIRSFYMKDLKTNSEILTEVTFDYYGLLVDVFLYRIDGEERYSYGYRNYDDLSSSMKTYKVIMFYYPKIKGFSTLPIDDHFYPVPANTVEMLKCYYGDEYMMPIKNYVTSLEDKKHKSLNYTEHRGYLKGFRSIADR